MVIGYEIIDHILLGLFNSYKTAIEEFEDISSLMNFVKKDMFTISLKNDTIDNLLMFETLQEYSQE